MRIPLDTMKKELERILLLVGFDEKRATLCASIFTENSLVGVASHGLNRFPLFIDYIRQGYINPIACAQLSSYHGAWEQYDGHLGPGPLNAYDCTQRCHGNYPNAWYRLCGNMQYQPLDAWWIFWLDGS